LIHQYKWSSQGFAGGFTKRQVEKLRKHPLVDHVAKDYYYKAIQVSSFNKSAANKLVSSSQTTPWGINRVNGPLDGTGKTAWILDTGIDLDHSDLNVDLMKSASFVANKSADDGLGHGTYVAGLLAAKNNSSNIVGVAAGASVAAVRVCDDNGGCYVSDVKAGVDYVAGNFSSGDVVNISLGYHKNDNTDIPLSDLENSITNAANSGLKFALSAGNASENSNNYSPARLETNNVWTVSAFDNNDTFSSFSNYGNPPIEYAAPGEDIRSLLIGGGSGMGFAGPGSEDGTSYSSPILAGLLLAADYGIDTDGTVLTDPDGNSDPIAVADEPEPTLTVSVSGPQYLNSGQSGTWSASVSYNDGPVSYEWFRRESPSDSWSSTSETSSSYTTYFYNGSSTDKHAGVKVEVSSAGENDSAAKTVIVSSSDCGTLSTTEGGEVTPNAPDPCY